MWKWGHTFSVLLFKPALWQSGANACFCQDQHIVLLPVRTSPASGGCLLHLAGGFWICRTGEREKFRFDSLRDPHLDHILGTGFRSSVQDARVTVTVCCEFSLKMSVPKQSLFFLVPGLKSYGAEPSFSPMHTLILPMCMSYFPCCSFLLSVKTWKLA